MVREITLKVGRYNVGSQYDYPRDVWNKISRDAGVALDKFSVSIDSSQGMQSSLKGRPKIHTRLGSAA